MSKCRHSSRGVLKTKSRSLTSEIHRRWIDSGAESTIHQVYLPKFLFHPPSFDSEWIEFNGGLIDAVHREFRFANDAGT